MGSGVDVSLLSADYRLGFREDGQAVNESE